MQIKCMIKKSYPPAVGVNIQSNTPKCANITAAIKRVAIKTVVIGPTLIPIEESSKKRMRPAPPIGIPPELLDLLFLRLDVLLDDMIKLVLF